MDNASISMRKTIGKIFKLIHLDKSEVTDIYLIAILAGIIQLTLPLGIQSIISFVQAGEALH